MSGNFVNGGDPVFSSGRLGNNHVQLTNYNYIHQKNCMRRPYSPIQAERSIMRDLLALQRSRSLRDPSTSPPSWKTNDRTGLECLMEQNPHHSMRRIRSPWLPPSSSSVVKPSTAEISNVEHNQNRMIRPMLGETVSSNHKPQAGKTRCKFAPQRCTQVLNIPPPKKMTRNRHAVRRVRQSMDSRRTRVHNESTSLEQYSMQHNYSSKGREEYDDDDGDEKMEGSEEATSNGCGILRNWSRIHHSGKTFLDKAGRSFACGISEPPIILTQRDTSVNAASDHSCGSIKSDSDVVPLLNDDTCGSQETGKHPFSNQDSYSGELGIFTNHDEHNNGSHKSLTQKYMPKTFKDVVGHNLIVQALTNAVQRKRVGLFYVFYGPQGTGKSSCARLFAKALNCVSLQLNRPCGACTSCVAYNLGKSRNIVEMSSPVGNFDFEKTLLASLSSQYMVFIIDDCDAFPFDFWHSISNIINRTRQHVVFILVSSSSSHDHLPHLITSRCQKFFFPKLKDTDIICKLQLIAFKEGLQIDMDAIKLIASRSDGSVRDAEMTLDQLSLIGQEISLNLVQELVSLCFFVNTLMHRTLNLLPQISLNLHLLYLIKTLQVGLVSNEKLIDLLDLALSANTVNTIKNLREIMEAGVEPIRLMSQLATIITDILAGSYILDQERLQRKFFRQSTCKCKEN